jgi:Ni/Fe-hydrogenase subunit HybB-like protein
MVVLGFITNRLNVSITGMEGAAGGHYLPKWTEFAITGMIVAAGFALFGLAAKYLPIFPDEKEHDAEAVQPEAIPVAAAVMTNAGD